MAASDKASRFDFRAWPGVHYVMDPNLPPDHFYRDPIANCFHIGEGTDIQLRLFYLNLTPKDLQWLKDLRISLGNK